MTVTTEMCFFLFFFCRIIWADDKCDGKESLGRLVEIHDNYHIDGVVGLPCSFGNQLELVCMT